MQTVYATQIKHFSLFIEPNTKQTINETVKCICDDILKRLHLGGELKVPPPSKHSFGIILKREVKRFNGLLELIRNSLSDLKRTINGLAVADKYFNETFMEIAHNTVPTIWLKCSYLTMKPLSSYIDDLLKRMEFFQGWSRLGQPNAFWFSAFYFPQALIKTIKMDFAKNHTIDIDDVDVKVELISFETGQTDEFDTFMKVSYKSFQ